MVDLGKSDGPPPEGTLGCGFCGEQPAMERYTRNPNEGASYSMKCVSAACSMRIVATHRCGDAESCKAVWNGNRAT